MSRGAVAKTWSPDDPKAALMTRKRAAIVAAALRAFLEAGYAEASVNRIAAAAGVSIKTLYRHFESKDELFSAVMHAACEGLPGAAGDTQSPAWLAAPPARALPLAGEDYLHHALSEEQMALYRVVVRDAHRFPEIGRRYREATTGARDAIFASYLELWAKRAGWRVLDRNGAAQVFAGLLKARLFEEALLGHRRPTQAEIAAHAKAAAQRMLELLESGSL